MIRFARWLIVPAVLATVLVAPGVGGASVRTTATIFRAFTPSGKPTLRAHSASGYCYTGSLTIDRSDAWRCFVGNELFDPCFSSSAARGKVLCPNLDVDGGTEIRLTKPLPVLSGDRPAPSLSDQPWNVELTSGHHCAFASGASNVVHGKRLNYFCGTGSHSGLWGYPERHTEPWTILFGPFTATSLNDRRAIRRAWM